MKMKMKIYIRLGDDDSGRECLSCIYICVVCLTRYIAVKIDLILKENKNTFI